MPDLTDIVARSVENSQANWKAAPQFSYKMEDILTRGGSRTDRTYKVRMIDGSPYNELIGENGEPLSPAQLKAQEQELQTVTNEREHQSEGARGARVAKYERGRQQDHALMHDMIEAMNFQLSGIEMVDGRECYHVTATPRPQYVPTSRQTKVLKGMRGSLWIDTKTYQWVKVEAEVFRPVAFGLFIAHVEPGTEFILEEKPVSGNIWEPSHFVTRVKAKILFWARNSVDDNHYSDYQRSTNN